MLDQFHCLVSRILNSEIQILLVYRRKKKNSLQGAIRAIKQIKRCLDIWPGLNDVVNFIVFNKTKAEVALQIGKRSF